MIVTTRPYSISDKESILEIFASNCPKYFAETDRLDLVHFLDNYADENFKVVLSDNKIIGCGGHYVKHSEKRFGIAWVMFKRHALGNAKFSSVTSMFFNQLLTNIRKEPFDYDIVIHTTQLLERYFNRFGFLTEDVIKGDFGENLDHYVMRRLGENGR